MVPMLAFAALAGVGAASASPPSAFCSSASTNALALWLEGIAPGALTEVQTCAGVSKCLPTNAYTYERGAGAPMTVRVPDLLHGTTYQVHARHLIGNGEWSSLAHVGACATLDLAPTQVGHVRHDGSAGEGDPGSLAVRWDEPSAPGVRGYNVEYGRVDGTPQDPVTKWVPAGKRRMRVRGLARGAEYSVRVQADFGRDRALGAWSDALSHRTRAPGVSARHVLRISEFCADNCQPDYLHERNSGDPLADVAFATMATGSPRSPFDIDPAHMMLVQYCLEHAEPQPFYLSCNPANWTNGTHTGPYACECANAIDRRIAHLSTANCTNATKHHNSRCTCEADELRRSFDGVGRLEIYWPFPWHNSTAAGTVRVGYWYSTPARVECGEQEAVGDGGCKWRRAPRQQQLLHGSELLAAGWRGWYVEQSAYPAGGTSAAAKPAGAAAANNNGTDTAMDKLRSWSPSSDAGRGGMGPGAGATSEDDEGLRVVRQNMAIVNKLLEQRTTRCCGC